SYQGSANVVKLLYKISDHFDINPRPEWAIKLDEWSEHAISWSVLVGCTLLGTLLGMRPTYPEYSPRPAQLKREEKQWGRGDRQRGRRDRGEKEPVLSH